VNDLPENAYSILHEPWWWDATALKGWAEATIEVEGQVVARWPYIKRHVGPGLTVITAPPLTNRSGPWIAPGEGKRCTRYSRDGELLTRLIEQLPNSRWFVQNLHPELEYWVPLHWSGFQLHARLSYVIDNCSDTDELRRSFSEATRRQLKKAERNLVTAEIDASAMIDLIRKTFGRQGKGMRVSPAVIESVMEAISRRQAGRAVGALDSSGTVHAAALLVWDSKRIYYLVGGGDPALRSSGAGTLVLWDGLLEAATRGLTFDFEGSMMPNVERFFRGFGARPSTYFSASKGSPLMRFAWSTLKSLRG
jgi:hypothetical protein